MNCLIFFGGSPKNFRSSALDLHCGLSVRVWLSFHWTCKVEAIMEVILINWWTWLANGCNLTEPAGCLSECLKKGNFFKKEGSSAVEGSRHLFSCKLHCFCMRPPTPSPPQWDVSQKGLDSSSTPLSDVLVIGLRAAIETESSHCLGNVELYKAFLLLRLYVRVCLCVCLYIILTHVAAYCMCGDFYICSFERLCTHQWV